MPVVTLVILFLVSMFFVAMIQVHIFEVAFAKLGLTPEAALLMLIGTLIGSGINLPLFSMRAEEDSNLIMSPKNKPMWDLFKPARDNQVIIGVNVGGCILPVGLSIYFISQQLVAPLQLTIGLLAITTLSYKFSRLIPGMGVGMPVFIAPLASAIVAVILDPAHAAHLAYVSGVLGVLIGADILRLKNIVNLGTPIAVIGGAGTFDGIFLTGILAALLA